MYPLFWIAEFLNSVFELINSEKLVRVELMTVHSLDSKWLAAYQSKKSDIFTETQNLAEWIPLITSGFHIEYI